MVLNAFFSCIYQYVLFQLYGASTEQYLNVSIILSTNILFYSYVELE